MPFATVYPAVTEGWRATVFCYDVNAQLSMNRWDYQVTSITGTGATDVECAQRLDAIAAPLYKAMMNVSATYFGVKFVRQAPKALTIPAESKAHIGPGTVGTTSSAAPTVICGTLQKQTQFIGRGKLGRIYTPFLDVAFLATNGVISGYQTLMQSLGNAMAAIITVTGAGGNTFLTPVIIGKGTTPVLRNVANIVAQQEAYSQHRRGTFGRPNVIPPF